MFHLFSVVLGCFLGSNYLLGTLGSCGLKVSYIVGRSEHLNLFVKAQNFLRQPLGVNLCAAKSHGISKHVIKLSNYIK